jgi:hypothetical protein
MEDFLGPLIIRGDHSDFPISIKVSEIFNKGGERRDHSEIFKPPPHRKITAMALVTGTGRYGSTRFSWYGMGTGTV